MVIRHVGEDDRDHDSGITINASERIMSPACRLSCRTRHVPIFTDQPSSRPALRRLCAGHLFLMETIQTIARHDGPAR